MIVATTAWVVVTQALTSWYARVYGVSNKRDHFLYTALFLFSITKMSEVLLILHYHLLSIPIKSLRVCVFLLCAAFVYQTLCYQEKGRNIYALISVVLTIILLGNCIYAMLYLI
jgi:hypothetical protein